MNRKTKVGLEMKLKVFGLAGLMSIASCVSATNQPNVVYIFADDMAYEALGAHGMLDIDTPNLDKLAERGATFTHAYNPEYAAKLSELRAALSNLSTRMDDPFSDVANPPAVPAR